MGNDDYTRTGLLPKKRWTWVRQIRVFRGELGVDVYERVTQLIRNESPGAMHVGMVGRILTAKSNSVEVTLMPGEDDELVLIVDRIPEPVVVGWIALGSAPLTSWGRGQ